MLTPILHSPEAEVLHSRTLSQGIVGDKTTDITAFSTFYPYSSLSV